MEEPRPSSNALIMALDQNRWVSPKRISKVLMFNMRPLLPQERSRHGATLTITLLTQSGISPPPQKKSCPVWLGLRLRRTARHFPVRRPPAVLVFHLSFFVVAGCGLGWNRFIRSKRGPSLGCPLRDSHHSYHEIRFFVWVARVFIWVGECGRGGRRDASGARATGGYKRDGGADSGAARGDHFVSIEPPAERLV